MNPAMERNEMTEVQKPRMFGEVYNDPASNLRRNIEKGREQTAPIHAEVARLQAEGLTGEQAWAEVLKRVGG